MQKSSFKGQTKDENNKINHERCGVKAECKHWQVAEVSRVRMRKRSKTVRHQGFHCRPRPEYRGGRNKGHQIRKIAS